MLLFLITVLIAFRASNIWTVIFFTIVSQVVWIAIVHNWLITIDVAELVPIALTTLCVGVAVHIWLQIRNHKAKPTSKIIKVATIVISSFILIIAVINGLTIYSAINQAKKDAKTNVIERNVSKRHEL